MMMLHLSDANINEFGRFDKLKATVDKAKAKEYFENLEGEKLPLPRVNIKLDKLLRDFILRGGFELSQRSEYSKLLPKAVLLKSIIIGNV